MHLTLVELIGVEIQFCLQERTDPGGTSQFELSQSFDGLLHHPLGLVSLAIYCFYTLICCCRVIVRPGTHCSVAPSLQPTRTP